MNKSISVVIVLFLFSCSDAPPSKYDSLPTIYEVQGTGDLKLYLIDSCEYIGKIRGNNTDVITHKGNCKYCAARNNKLCK